MLTNCVNVILWDLYKYQLLLYFNEILYRHNTPIMQKVMTIKTFMVLHWRYFWLYIRFLWSLLIHEIWVLLKILIWLFHLFILLQQGTTPLQLTAKLGKSHYLKALLSQPGIDVNMTDMNGNTALHWSVINHHPNCLTILLSHPDVKVDIINHNGLCVLQNEGLNEIRGKIVLCGETGSGKSTLAEVSVQFIGNDTSQCFSMIKCN